MSDEPENDYHHDWAQQRRHTEELHRSALKHPGALDQQLRSAQFERDLLVGRIKAVLYCIDIGAVTTVAEAKDMLCRALTESKR